MVTKSLGMRRRGSRDRRDVARLKLGTRENVETRFFSLNILLCEMKNSSEQSRNECSCRLLHRYQQFWAHQSQTMHSVIGLFFWQCKDLIGPNVEIYGLNKNKAQV